MRDKKLVVTLDLGYPSQITKMTFPYMKIWCEKIEADFKILNTRKFPEYSVSMEKFQIREYLKDYDWVFFLDADLLIHPDTIDMTMYLQKDMILHWAWMLLGSKYKMNKIFLRDDRKLGIASTFLCVSNWMEDLFDMDIEFPDQEKISNQIILTQEENLFAKNVSDIQPWMEKNFYTDEFFLAYNLSRFGLNGMAIEDFFRQEVPIYFSKESRFAHEYLWTIPQKEKMIKDTIYQWRLN
jgi:hypothetical protein